MQEEKILVQPIALDTFPLFLQKRRKHLGKTQEQIANAAGIHKSTYIRYEKGEAAPNLMIAQWILGAMGCELQLIAIVGGRNEPIPKNE